MYNWITKNTFNVRPELIIVFPLKQRALPLAISFRADCSDVLDHVSRVSLQGWSPAVVQEAADLHVVQCVLGRPTQVAGAQHGVTFAFVIAPPVRPEPQGPQPQE